MNLETHFEQEQKGTPHPADKKKPDKSILAGLIVLAALILVLGVVLHSLSNRHSPVEKIANLFQTEDNDLLHLDLYEETDSELIFYMTVGGDISRLASEAALTGSDLKVAVLGALQGGVNLKWLKKTLEELGLAWVFEITNPETDETYTFEVSPSELEPQDETASIGLTPGQKKLARMAANVNLTCPREVEEGVVMSSVTFEDGNVVYTYDVDEDLVCPVADLLYAGSEMADGLQENLSSSILHTMAEQCADAGADIHFAYVGQSSGDVLLFIYDTTMDSVTYELLP